MTEGVEKRTKTDSRISPSAQYDWRRDARKPEDRSQQASWMRRLRMPVLAVMSLALIGLIAWITWRLNHVWTVRAKVCSAVIMLSSDVDAHLKELYVKPGQRVTKGQVVARLDDSEARATLAGAEAARAIRESAFAEAKAERDMTAKQVEAEIALAAARVESARARLDSARADVMLREKNVEQEILGADAAFHEATARLEQVRKGSRPEAIEAARQRLEAANALVDLYQYQVERSETLRASGVVSEYELETLKTKLITQRHAAREAEFELASLAAGSSADIEISSHTVAARRASLEKARAGTEEVKVKTVGLGILEAELREAQAELKRAQARETEIPLADEKVRAAENELRRAEADVQARRALLERMSLKSPADGLVIRTYVHEGELCRKAAPCVQITDDAKGWWVEGHVLETDAPWVKPGQSARIEIIVGSVETLDATVEAVAMATSSVDQGAEQTPGTDMTRARPAETVWIKLRPAASELHPLPGMTARARIRVD